MGGGLLVFMWGGGRYEGDFLDGYLHGRGILTYPDGGR